MNGSTKYNDQAKSLLDLIDNRIEKKLAEAGISRYIPASVISVSDTGKSALVIYRTDESRHELLNKTGETLSQGDSVLVEFISGESSNAIIRIRFGETT